MLSVEQIQDWRGQDVLDRDGKRIGKLDEVFYDSASGEASFASVKSGLLGRRNNLVSLAGATVSRDHVRVTQALAEVEGVEVEEVDGQLKPDGARRAAHLYGVTFAPDTRFESATLLSERRAEVAKVAERADELEGTAARRAQQAEVSRGRAHDAARETERAEHERDEAQLAAAAAREEADDAARDVPPPPADS